jgi:hypothetical protein
VPSLDGENIVMGRVLEGLGTVAQVAAVPTFTPSERLQALNRVASLIGDDRAAKARHSRPHAPCCPQSRAPPRAPPAAVHAVLDESVSGRTSHTPSAPVSLMHSCLWAWREQQGWPRGP